MTIQGLATTRPVALFSVLALSAALAGCGGGDIPDLSNLVVTVSGSDTAGDTTFGTTTTATTTTDTVSRDPADTTTTDPAGTSEPTGTTTQPTVSQVSLSWTAPTQRENGQTLAMNELAGYRIYYTSDTSQTAQVIEITDPYMFDYTIQSLQPGTYHFTVTAIDTDGRESGRSNEVTQVEG